MRLSKIRQAKSEVGSCVSLQKSPNQWAVQRASCAWGLCFYASKRKARHARYAMVKLCGSYRTSPACGLRSLIWNETRRRESKNKQVKRNHLTDLIVIARCLDHTLVQEGVAPVKYHDTPCERDKPERGFSADSRPGY